MSRIILALFLLVVLVVIQIEAQRKCRRYETICIRGRGCKTRCIRRGRRDVSEALERTQRELEEENAARDLEEMAKRFEEDVDGDEEERNVDEEEEVRDVEDDGNEEEVVRDNDDTVEDEEMEARILYDDLEEE